MFGELVTAYLFLAGVGAGGVAVASVADLLLVREPFGADVVPDFAEKRPAERLVVGVLALSCGALALGAGCLAADLGRIDRVLSLFLTPPATLMNLGAWAVALLTVLAAALALARAEAAFSDAAEATPRLLELARRLVSKGYGQYLPRLRGADAQKLLRLEKACVTREIVFKQFLVALAHGTGKVGGIICLAVFDEVYDAVDEHGGFSAARSRKYQKRSFGSKDRFKLHIIHSTEVFFDYLLS